MRKLLVAMMAGSFLINPAGGQVGGGLVFCTNCATEPTQVSVKVMHDLEYAKQLLQYAIQVQPGPGRPELQRPASQGLPQWWSGTRARHARCS
jgi:hypothetical protein